jgi:hypothetical protein
MFNRQVEFSMPKSELWTSIVDVVRGWDQVEVKPHRFGGQAFCWGRVEIGHIHHQGFVDIPFNGKRRDQIVDAGLAHPHHILPDSGWVTIPLRSEHDIQLAIDLLQLSYDLKRARRDQDPQIGKQLERHLAKLGLQ